MEYGNEEIYGGGGDRPDSEPEYAVNIKGLTKHYEGFTLQDVDLQIPKGTVLGLIGENGAGKTTTIKAMLNLIRRDGGTVELLGERMDEGRAGIRERIGVVLGESHFHDFLNAAQVSKIMGDIYRSWDRKQFAEYLKRFSLPEQKRVKEYSKGMMMKLSIAAALSHHPDLLILDEATGGLDPVVRDKILDLLFEFIEDGEHSVLVSSHITSDLDKVADYIVMLHQGRVLLSEEKDALMDRMGVVRCREEDLTGFTGLAVIGVRKSAYQTECLIGNRQEAMVRYPELVVDPANVEEIMLYFMRGEEA